MKCPRLAAFVAALSPFLSFAQSSCPNIGFEDGDFTGWVGYIGSCCPIYAPTQSIVTGRHTIMTGSGLDPVTNVITVVAPGGALHSARLGNSDVDSEAEKLSYTMAVDAGSALFVYRYAVVLQDPAHDPPDQPRFEIRTFDENNQPIPCGQYSVTATSGVPGFVSTYYDGDTLRYKDWTAVGMDLTPYIGQDVTIEFSTGDCAQGAHFGYAYLDCYCSALQISTDYCPSADSTLMEAPEGFASYLWNTGDTTSSIMVINPQNGDTYTCLLTSVTGCSVTVSTVLEPSIVESDFGQIGDCMNNVQFGDSSVVISGPPIASWFWDFGDGTTSDEQNPLHQFPTTGPYQVMMVALSSEACPDTIIQTVNLLQSPVVDMTFGEACAGAASTFEDVTPIINAVADRHWDFGDSTAWATAASVPHVFDDPGTYDVTLFVMDQNGCSDSLTETITVFGFPLVDIGPDQDLCPGATIDLITGGAQDYLWSTGSTDPGITVTTPGIYWVEASNADCARIDSVTISATPSPGQLGSSIYACAESSVNLSIPYENGVYAWDNGDTSQMITVTEIGDYGFVLTDAYGCTYADVMHVVFDPLGLGVVVPNVFSPNGDGKNERFQPDGGGNPKVEVTIYDRFGMTMFTSASLNELWNGTFEGGAVPEGTYFYIVRYQPMCETEVRTERGAVTLLR